MFSTRFIQFTIIAAAAVAAACTRAVDTDPGAAPDAEPASLTIDFSTAGLGIDVETRSLYETELDPDHPDKMTPEAAIVEGSQMTCLTVFLIHKRENRIVGVRTIKQGASALDDQNGFIDKDGNVDPTLAQSSRARVTFDYENPKHQVNGESAERLLRGEYRLFAVANYNHTIITSDNTVNVEHKLDEIFNKFLDDPVNGIPNFNPDYKSFYDIRFLLNRTLDGQGNVVHVDPKSYIRPAVNQTLSATPNVFLAAGNNHLSVKLLRISSRTRVEVKNYSTVPLHVHSLAFSDNYTQSTNFLFRREDNQANYQMDAFTDHDGRGAPDVSYSRAIVSFDKQKGVDVPANEKKCIFDALMYESYDDKEPFTYTIDVSYPDVTNYKTTDRDKLDQTKTITETSEFEYEYALKGENKHIAGMTSAADLYNTLTTNYSSDYFLIQGVQTGKYLYARSDGTLHANLLSRVDFKAPDIKSYLWTVEVAKAEQDGNVHYTCSLKNVATGKYMPLVPNGEDANLGGSSDQVWNTLGVTSTHLTLAANHLNKDGVSVPYYLSIWADGDNLGGWTEADGGCQYDLLPVKYLQVLEGTPRVKKTVTLTAFNDATAIVEEVHEIQRNDFVRILVEVSYNPDKGDFTFQVEPWDKGSGEVTFN